MEFNIFRTFYRTTGAIKAAGYDWVQVIDGKPLVVWTKAEFKRELKRIAKAL